MAPSGWAAVGPCPEATGALCNILEAADCDNIAPQGPALFLRTDIHDPGFVGFATIGWLELTVTLVAILVVPLPVDGNALESRFQQDLRISGRVQRRHS